MKKNFFIILITLCFLWRGCAEGASAPANNVPIKANSVKITTAKTTQAQNAPKKIATSQIQKIQPIENAPVQPSAVQPQPVDFGMCNKFFKLNSQKLFYLTLAGVNANRFKIEEIQSKSGYVLFTVAQKQFLASVINIDSQNSMLKITPCSNIYYFPIGIVQNMFKYIELNISTPIEKLSVL